jgi:hypothetical protein
VHLHCEIASSWHLVVDLLLDSYFFGGCRHLDGLEQLGGVGKVGDCFWPPLVIVRGLCLPRRSAKGNVSELLVSFATFCHLVGSCGAF